MGRITDSTVDTAGSLIMDKASDKDFMFLSPEWTVAYRHL